MAEGDKHIDVLQSDVIVIGTCRCEVVDDREGGLALEPALIGPTVAELHAKHRTRELTPQEFEEHFGDLPHDPVE